MKPIEQFTRNQHHVPQFYLKEFAARKGRMIDVFDTLTNSIEKRSIEQVCSEPFLYEDRIGLGDGPDAFLQPNRIENALKKEEDTQRPAIQHAIAAATGGGNISDVDRSLIADFVITTLLREPDMLQYAAQVLIEGTTATEELNSYRSFINAFFSKNRINTPTFDAFSSAACKRIILEPDSSIGALCEPRNEMKRNLMSMGFSLLVSSKRERFVTTSSPITMRYGKPGPGQHERLSILWVALSPRVVALFGRQDLPPKEIVAKETVKLLNGIALRRAYKERGLVFASSRKVLEALET